MSKSTSAPANVTFANIIADIKAPAVAAAKKKLVEAYAARAKIEEKKAPTNDKIHKSLKASLGVLEKDVAIQVLIAAQAAPDFITRSSSEGKHYNVYAGNKVADLVQALSAGFIKNQVNNAVTRSLFAFRKAGEAFTGEMARAAVSDKIRVQGQVAKLLVRHTVSPATAPTQASSTMQALTTLGIVENTGTRREPIYKLTDTPQTRRLEEVIAKAA